MNNVPAGGGISGGLPLIGSFWMVSELIRGFISVDDWMGGVFLHWALSRDRNPKTAYNLLRNTGHLGGHSNPFVWIPLLPDYYESHSCSH